MEQGWNSLLEQMGLMLKDWLSKLLDPAMVQQTVELYEQFYDSFMKEKKFKSKPELENIIERLEHAISESKNHGTVHITVEHIHVHRAVLESLTLCMDKLDIKELSGSLNIGNNMGAMTHQTKPEVEVKEASLTRTSSGYSYKQ